MSKVVSAGYNAPRSQESEMHRGHSFCTFGRAWTLNAMRIEVLGLITVQGTRHTVVLAEARSVNPRTERRVQKRRRTSIWVDPGKEQMSRSLTVTAGIRTVMQGSY